MNEPINGSAAAAPAASQGAHEPSPGAPGTGAAGQPASAAATPPPLDAAYLDGIAATGGERAGLESFGRALRSDFVQAEAGNAILSWLHETRQRGSAPAPEKEAHSYDVDLSRFSPEDRPVVVDFLNRMAARGVDQGAVDSALRTYDKIERAAAVERAANERLLEEASREAAKMIGADLRALDPDEFETNRVLLVEYLRGLSPEEQKATDELSLRELVQRARNAGPSAGMTREQIEEVMRTDRARYNRDLRMQARYRDVLTNGNSAPKPIPTERARLNEEIAAIEAKIGTRAYSTDEKMQARLRELYGARDGADARGSLPSGDWAGSMERAGIGSNFASVVAELFASDSGEGREARISGLANQLAAGGATRNDLDAITRWFDSLPEVAAVDALAKEITEHETFMRENRGAYNRDPAKQARLRDLYRARDGA